VTQLRSCRGSSFWSWWKTLTWLRVFIFCTLWKVLQHNRPISSRWLFNVSWTYRCQYMPCGTLQKANSFKWRSVWKSKFWIRRY